MAENTATAPPAQSTQYNQIGALYDGMKLLPAAQLERFNLRNAISPFIKGARVLDLACGTGYYSAALIEWGARQVVGVDISNTMVEAARRRFAQPDLQDQQFKVSFVVGDATVQPLELGAAAEGEGEFDIVLGAWLLNYAPDGEVMTSMFKNISARLRPGGRFVGIAPRPTSDPCSIIDEDPISREQAQYGISVNIVHRIEGGCKMHIIGYTSPDPVQFDAYHLRRAIYDESARKGGMKGNLKWKNLDFPDTIYGKPIFEGYWDACRKGAIDFGILLLEK